MYRCSRGVDGDQYATGIKTVRIAQCSIMAGEPGYGGASKGLTISDSQYSGAGTGALRGIAGLICGIFTKWLSTSYFSLTLLRSKVIPGL